VLRTRLKRWNLYGLLAQAEAIRHEPWLLQVLEIEEGERQNRSEAPLRQCAATAVTPEGLPLALSAIKFWTRDKFKGCTALKRHVNPTRVPLEYKESMCWIDNMLQSTRTAG
jgi:hypothetical protein